ncbi:MAG: glycerol-3-phosphate 1-O-acyltransferase PlsY [Bacteroidetes bacterium]|nr:glycerol-3-phosphate 1-O-acyltransferase PlsY [Bacteroidota bacterium]
MTTSGILGMLFAYLLGSVPSAVWIGKAFFNTDVREHGSGNAGATNTFRVLGKRAGIPVLIMDCAKGYFAVMLAYFISTVPPGTEDFVNTQLVLGTAAVLGHIFPVLAGFRGGKGIATLLGVTLAINPFACAIVAALFMLVFLGTHYVSLSSIAAGIAYPVVIIVFFKHHVVPAHVVFSCMVAMLILITHQKNIERLLSKTESKMFLVKRKEEDASATGEKEEEVLS